LAATSSLARAPRNDLLPALDLVYLLLEDLRMPARGVRELDPIHVREVANSISTLGFCARRSRLARTILSLTAPYEFTRRGFSTSAVRRVSGSNI
jgi:hypothetical protein